MSEWSLENLLSSPIKETGFCKHLEPSTMECQALLTYKNLASAVGAEDLQMQPKKICSVGSYPKPVESSFGPALRIFATRRKKLDLPLVLVLCANKREPAALLARGGIEREMCSRHVGCRTMIRRQCLFKK